MASGTVPVEVCCIGLCMGSVFISDELKMIHVVVLFFLVIVIVDRIMIWRRCNKQNKTIRNILERLKMEGGADGN